MELKWEYNLKERKKEANNECMNEWIITLHKSFTIKNAFYPLNF